MKAGHLTQVVQPLAPAGDNKDCLTRLVADVAASFPNMADTFSFSYKAYSEKMQYQAEPWKIQSRSGYCQYVSSSKSIS